MTQPPTHEAILASMKPGSGYAVHMLAIKLGIQPHVLKPVLLEMFASGKLSKFLRGKNTCFVIPGTEHMRRAAPGTRIKAAVIDPAMVALPRTASPFTGELTGYFAEINRRAALAMMVRPR